MKAVLIANRGEIAVRVARAARDHGIKSIAIYSDEDRTSLHVATADEAYALQGLSAAETYLDQNKIIEIAKKYTPLKIKNVVPIKSHEYPSKVVRPKYSTLSCQKIKSDFNIEQLSWKPYLEKVIKNLIEE